MSQMLISFRALTGVSRAMTRLVPTWQSFLKQHVFTPDGWTAQMVPASNYGHSKYLGVFHAAELARREKNVTAYSLHPGVVKTPLTKGVPFFIDWEFCALGHSGYQTPCPRSQGQGASGATYLAVAPRDELTISNGLYFDSCSVHESMHSKHLAQHGEKATIEYQSAIYDLALNLTKPAYLLV